MADCLTCGGAAVDRGDYTVCCGCSQPEEDCNCLQGVTDAEAHAANS